MTTTPLYTVLAQAEAERDQAAAALRRSEEQLRRLQAQAEQLTGYRADYQRRWSAQFAQGGAIEIVQCYQSFMARLEEALAQQRAQTAQVQAHSARLHEQLLGAEMRVAAVKKLIERRHAEERRVQAQRDQRQTDESAQQLRWRAAQAEPLHP